MSVKVDSGHRHSTSAIRVIRYRNGKMGSPVPDDVITEEPLEIRVEGPGGIAEPYATVMRTPGNDFELAVGFLASEGVIRSRSDFATVCYCALTETEEQRYNVVTVSLRSEPQDSRNRTTAVSSACGVCGSQSIEDVRKQVEPVDSEATIAAAEILALPNRLRKRQRLFSATGAVHAAGLADTTGRIELCREDVGRHNAVDKLLGKALMDAPWPLSSRVLVLSGRIAFELVQKAAIASVPIVVAVGAPSSLAIELADECQISLIGFAGTDHFNVYTHVERVVE